MTTTTTDPGSSTTVDESTTTTVLVAQSDDDDPDTLPFTGVQTRNLVIAASGLFLAGVTLIGWGSRKEQE